jgi:replication-associated recombination protein RarA
MSKTPQTRRGYDIFEAVSALQKCIRRGDEFQAVYWAQELEGFNARMVWNRLRVIASEDIGLANPVSTLVVDVLERNYADAVRRDNDSSRLFLVHAVLYLAKSSKNRMVDDLLITVYGQVQFEKLKLPVPDYALDMHTGRGKRMGRGIKHFLEEGIKIVNEAGENPYKGSAAKILMKYGKP